jgi:hypothetical protein
MRALLTAFTNRYRLPTGTRVNDGVDGGAGLVPQAFELGIDLETEDKGTFGARILKCRTPERPLRSTRKRAESPFGVCARCEPGPQGKLRALPTGETVLESTRDWRHLAETISAWPTQISVRGGCS